MHQNNYDFERVVLRPGLEAVIKRRELHKLVLKRDDGQGWRGSRPDFGELGKELDKRLGVQGVVEMIDDLSNIKYNRSVFRYTGTSQTWEIAGGLPLEWTSCGELPERLDLKRLVSI